MTTDLTTRDARKGSQQFDKTNIRKKPSSARGKNLLVFLLSLGALLVIWELLASSFGMEFIFPGPLVVTDSFFSAINNGSLAEATLASLGRIFFGFLMGSVIGIALGLLFGSSKIFLGLTAPFVTFFRFVPPLAWFAPALVWFGAGETSKIVLVMYTSIFVVALSTLEAKSGIPDDLQRMASATGISGWNRMLWITLPASVPYIVAGARVAMGNAFMTVVSAEMLGASSGLGVLINNGMITTNIPPVFTAIFVLGVLGFLADRLFVLLINTVGRRYQTAQDGSLA